MKQTGLVFAMLRMLIGESLMIAHKPSYKIAATLMAFFSILLSTSVLPQAGATNEADKKPAPAIRVTPPAPVFDNAARLA